MVLSLLKATAICLLLHVYPFRINSTYEHGHVDQVFFSVVHYSTSAKHGLLGFTGCVYLFIFFVYCMKEVYEKIALPPPAMNKFVYKLHGYIIYFWLGLTTAGSTKFGFWPFIVTEVQMCLQIRLCHKMR